MAEVEIAYRGTMVKLSEALIERLGRMGVTVDEGYLDTVCENRSPLGDTPVSMLVRQDMWNRALHSQEDGLGRIVAYLDDGPRLYDRLYDAIVDNWEKRPEMGFERLHEASILPTLKRVERFGVAAQARPDIRLRALNDLSKTIYRYKNGVTWLRLYERSAGKPGVEDLELDEFLRRMSRFFASSLGNDVVRAIERHQEAKDSAKSRDERAYRDALSGLLARYSDDDGNTVFAEVDDLNEYRYCSGIYVLGIDDERRYYVGQAGRSIRDRVLDHFRKPGSTFDHNHTLADVSSIHVLPVYDEWFGLVDRAEADCIATLGREHVLNSEAASPAWFESKARLLGNYEKLDPEISADALFDELYAPVMVSGIGSGSYDPKHFQLTDDEVRRVVKDASFAIQASTDSFSPKEAPRHAKRSRPIAKLDDDMHVLETFKSVAEASRSVGVSTKCIRDAANGVQIHAGGYVWRYADDLE